MNVKVAIPPRNIGREDRLIRGILALVLVAMSFFGLFLGQQVTLIALGFGALAAYFGITAIAGRDYLYQRFDVDTRSDEEIEDEQWRAYEKAQLEYQQAVARANGAPAVIDLQVHDPAPQAPGSWGSSLLGR